MGAMSSTLAIDCGGTFIKASVLDDAGTMRVHPVQVKTPYPMTPHDFVETLAGIAADLPGASRVTVGLPGMIRHGVAVMIPHYTTKSGPRSPDLPELVAQWYGFDVRAAIEAKLGIPALVLNDAEVHGAGAVAGSGLEVMLTLGTGLGFALFDGGMLAPHLELSQAPVRNGVVWDTYIGEQERKRLGNTFWSRRVKQMVDTLRPVFIWDRLYLGGGNSRNIRPEVLQSLGDDVIIVSNTAALVGGVRAWQLAADYT